MLDTSALIPLTIIYIDLILAGLLFATPERVLNRIIHECDLAIKIVLAFILWGSQCGRVSYVITSEYNGNTREVYFG